MLTRVLAESAQIGWTARPEGGEGAARPVLNPADRRDVVGTVFEASTDFARAAVARADGSGWARAPVTERAAILERAARSEEHTSELQSLMRISYAVFCLKKKKNKQTHNRCSYN